MRFFEGTGIKRDLVRAYQMLRLADDPVISGTYLSRAILEMNKAL